MNTNTLITIMAHAGGQETFNRHLPYWEAHQCPILVYCPQGSYVQSDHPLVAWGTASHHSTHANERFIWLLRFLQTMDFDVHWIFEYDALCLQPDLNLFQHILPVGNVFHDDRPDRGFTGKTFIHPPLRFTAGALEAVVASALRFPAEMEQGFWDRWLGLVCESTIGCKSWFDEGQGYSRNTIDDLKDARQAVLDGAVLIHGCKSADCLRVLADAYRERQSRPAPVPVPGYARETKIVVPPL